MKSILEAFAYDNLLVCPRSMEEQSAGGQLLKEICKLEDALDATLNDDEKELLKKLEDAHSDSIDCSATERFIRGYRLGVLMTFEVFAGRDSLIAQ